MFWSYSLFYIFSQYLSRYFVDAYVSGFDILGTFEDNGEI